MSILVEDTGSATLCSFTFTSLSAPTGETVTLRVIGEVDLSTVDVLAAALADGLARRPTLLVVDLTELRFCSVRGLTLLVEYGVTAAGVGASYAVRGASVHLQHMWTVLWPGSAVAEVDPQPARARDHEGGPVLVHDRELAAG